MVNNNAKSDDRSQCDHRYIVGYSARVPSAFNDKVLCDRCGSKIRLALSWRIMYWIIDVISIIGVFLAIDNVSIEIFNSSFLPAVAISSAIYLVIQQIKKPLLKHSKWIELD